jgi:hypothetical protein
MITMVAGTWNDEVAYMRGFPYVARDLPEPHDYALT